MAWDEASIARYYDYTLPYYDLLWHGATNGVHYGFKDATTYSHEDELINTNRFLARAAEVRSGDRVLDVGCGIGGSALWLAQVVGAYVVGMTLSARQVRRARSLARRYGFAAQLQFEQGNVLTNKLPSGSFDVVWALESACYLAHSHALYREAYRLLRPGGRIVLGDGFLLRPPASGAEQALLDDFSHGLLLPGLTEITVPPPRLAACGFTNIRSWNQTDAIRPSARRLARLCRAGYALSLIGERLRLTDAMLTHNNRAGIAQYELVKRGVAGYGVFVAAKPESS